MIARAAVRCWLAALSCLLFGGLAGCAVSPESAAVRVAARESVGAFALLGRVAVTHGDSRASVRVEWRHAAGQDDLLLSSPFGQGLAELTRGPRGARLVLGDGEVREADDAESLLAGLFGVAVPVSGLASWVLGRPLADGILRRDDRQRPLRLDEAGWRIDYAYDDEHPDALPGRVTLVRPDGTSVLIKVDQWQIP